MFIMFLSIRPIHHHHLPPGHRIHFNFHFPFLHPVFFLYYFQNLPLGDMKSNNFRKHQNRRPSEGGME